MNIWVVSPQGYIHSQAFEMIALSLRDALRELGYKSEVITTPQEDKMIILGAHLVEGSLNKKHIIFNLEQIGKNTSVRYLELLSGNEVWDYSELNIKELSKYGIYASICGVGYMPVLERIKPKPEVIDVVFVGSINERRKKILDGLALNKVSVIGLYNCYGEQADNYISRAKIILNLHFYESKVFEVARCSYALANHKCVVSEFGEDEKLEEPFYKAIAFAEYDEIIPTCLHYLEHEEERKQQAANGYEIFKGMRQSDMLRKVLI